MTCKCTFLIKEMVFNYLSPICFRNHIKQCEMESEITPNGISSWNEEEEEDSDGLGFTKLDQILPERKQNGIQSHKDSTAIFNGHTHNTCTSALKTQDCLVPSSNSVASRFSPGPVQEEGKPEKGIVDFRDCTMQQLQQSNKNTDFSWNPHRTMSNSSSSSSLHSNTKINGAHHSTVQGPSSTKSTSVPTPSKAASLSVSKPSDCSFISDFYSRSRLHHISTWKCELTEFVNSLQRKNSGVFPGREKLKKWKAGRSALKTDTGRYLFKKVYFEKVPYLCSRTKCLPETKQGNVRYSHCSQAIWKSLVTLMQ